MEEVGFLRALPYAFVSRVCIITYCPKDCKQNPTTWAMRSGFLPGSVGYNTGKGLYRIKTRTAPFGRKLPGSQIEKGQNRRVFSRNRDRMCYHWPVGPSAGLSPAFFSSEACPRSQREFWPRSGLWASLGSPQTDQGQAVRASKRGAFRGGRGSEATRPAAPAMPGTWIQDAKRIASMCRRPLCPFLSLLMEP